MFLLVTWGQPHPLEQLVDNQHYVAYATIFGLQGLEESMQPNPDHGQEMQDFVYYKDSAQTGGDTTGDGDVVV